MADLARVMAVVVAYVGLLFLLAIWAERQEARGRRVARNALVYSLSLAVYHTTWTFYGSVGSAASSGLLFLGVYLGPTLGAVFWSQTLRRMVRIKDAHRVTSVADLLSVRYEKSQGVAMVATVALLIGLVPYIALQLKTMIFTVGLLTGHDPSRPDPGIGMQVGPVIVILMVMFTIVFGLRRLSPTERHPGMMVALAAEGLVKLVAFVAAGAFVTYGLFDGFGDIFRRAAAERLMPDLLGRGSVATLLSHVVLSASAILFLPRQFHVAVVENSDARHLRTASWAFPSYMLAINVFVLPLALAGLLLGHPANAADSFVLSLPHAAGARWLSWLVFLGGFSAGTGMVMAEAMALATMVSNHLVLPAIGLSGRLEGLRRHVLPSRWLAAAFVIVTAFAYERAVGSQYELVSIGLISFAAVLVLAPSILGGLYWRGASKAGALAALTAGFAIWGYTLIIPVLARGGWLPQELLTEGPFGIGLLRPEALLGLGALDRISHAVFWILFVDVGAFVVGSVLFPAAAEEVARAERLIAPMEASAPRLAGGESRAVADVSEKRTRIVQLLAQYHEESAAARLAEQCLAKVGANAATTLSALQLAELEAEVEASLAACIGTAAAHAALKRNDIVTQSEARAISRAYGRILTALKVPPAELRRKIDYHRERERLLANEAAAQRFLADVSVNLAGSLDIDTTGRNVVQLAVPRLVDDALLWVAPRSEHDKARVWFASKDPERETRVRPALEAALPSIPVHSCIARALESGRSVVNASASADSWPPALHEAAGFAGDATFPLVAGGKTLGALTLFLSDTSRFQVPQDVALAEELAHRSAIALVNATLFHSAEDAVRARDEFLAVASHELKTPLTPLWVSIQTLQRLAARGQLANLPEGRLDRALRGADGQIRRLVGLVDDLLDISRITTRRLKLKLEPMPLVGVMRDVVARHQNELVQAGCTVAITADGDANGRWDRLRIEQVFTNLLTNAMKYAPGTIEISVASQGGTARIMVRDHGPGIAPQDQERIFLPFERAVSYLNASGFGLGLYIVRQIVDAHGGAVLLDSAPGRGSTFVIELPLQAPASA
jgi:signal transduction histidine kinase/Na+/proline symporter